MVSPRAVYRQLAIAVRAFLAVASAPWMLVYPVIGGVFMAGIPIGVTAALVAFTPPPVVMVTAWASMFVVMPVVYSVLAVAYCHEINAVFVGRRPPPGSGLLVALGRAPRVAAAGLIVGTGGFVVHSTSEAVPFGRLVGIASKTGLRIAGVFAFPAVATTNASMRETMSDVVSTAEAQWGTSLVATTTTKALGTVIAWTGIVAAVALLAAGFLRLVPGVWPIGPLTLPILVGSFGIYLAFTVQFAIDGVLKTALYRYAHDGQLPQALATDPETVFTVDGAADVSAAGHSAASN